MHTRFALLALSLGRCIDTSSAVLPWKNYCSISMEDPLTFGADGRSHVALNCKWLDDPTLRLTEFPPISLWMMSKAKVRAVTRGCLSAVLSFDQLDSIMLKTITFLVVSKNRSHKMANGTLGLLPNHTHTHAYAQTDLCRDLVSDRTQ